MKLPAIWLLLPCAVTAQVRILGVEPTVLFPTGMPLRQIAIVEVLNEAASPIGCEITTDIGGTAGGPALKVEAPPGASKHRVLVNDMAQPALVEFVMRDSSGARVLATRKVQWQPQRKWKVYIVKSSHEDLGYENFIFHKQRDIADFIDLAAELSGSRENVTEAERASSSQYQYTMESLLFQRNYIEERGLVAWRRIVDRYLRPGTMHLMGAPSGVHSHWMDYEELARMTYPGRREVKDRYGLDLKTFMIVDNPSLSWSGAQVVSDAGYRYVARWGQSWRTGGNNNYATTKLPALFWWKAPDGFHRVLFGWRQHYGLVFWYGQTGGGYGNLLDLASEHVSSRLKRVEDGSELGPYPYDALVNPEYIDHDTPRFDTRVLPEWRKRFAYPEIRIASPTEFFEYIEEKYGDQLPELSGDLNNFSADYATIDPESQGWKRRAARLLPAAEGIAALASLFDPGYLLSPSVVERTYTRLHDYDEHSWPTLPRASDVQLFNASWVKKQEAERALNTVHGIWKQTFTALSSNIATGDAPAIAVFNSLTHARSGLVTVEGTYPAVIDPATGDRLPVQRDRDGRGFFIARDVPAFGYKLYQQGGEAESVRGSDLSAGPDFIANEFYLVRFDPDTGGVKSIIEKSSGRELVDGAAPHQLNQMVYVHKTAREAKDGFTHTSTRPRKQENSIGPLTAEFHVWIDDEKTGGSVLQTVTLYSRMKRIDFVNRLSHVRALFTASHEERYRENIYFAFPFKVENGQFRVEYPGGVVRPFYDQLRWGSHDYLYANRWVDVSNGKHGITLAPWNAGTFSFGGIRYNQFSIDYQPKNSHLYSYAWSNRMAGLLTLTPDDLNATFGYSLTSHDGDWNSGAATSFGWTTASPLESFALPGGQTGQWKDKARSFLDVSASNVQLVVLKSSAQPGRGVVARFVETEGKPAEFHVNLNGLNPARAFLCDLVENDLQPIVLSGSRVTLQIRPYGFATIRFEGKAEPAGEIKLTVKGDGDSSAILDWTGAHASAYNVYRSVDPKDPATAQTLIARVKGTHFVDRGLHLQTRYIYRVAPVSAFNQQGALSAAVEVQTTGPNLTPPEPVEELGVVRRSPHKLMVYWRSSPEPDVARYHVYRGDTAEFTTEGRKPLATLTPARYFLQLFSDESLAAGRTWYYKVLAEDWAGNRQTVSPVASATTPRP